MSPLSRALSLLACSVASATFAVMLDAEADGRQQAAAREAAEARRLDGTLAALQADLKRAGTAGHVTGSAPGATLPAEVTARNDAAVDPLRRVADLLALLQEAEDVQAVRWKRISLQPVSTPPLERIQAGASLPGAPVGDAGPVDATRAAPALVPADGALGSAPRGAVLVQPAGAAAIGATVPLDQLFTPLPQAPALAVARLSASGEVVALAPLLALLDTLPDHGTAVGTLALEQEQVRFTAWVVATRP